MSVLLRLNVETFRMLGAATCAKVHEAVLIELDILRCHVVRLQQHFRKTCRGTLPMHSRLHIKAAEQCSHVYMFPCCGPYR
jgi:hypothetical protein